LYRFQINTPQTKPLPELYIGTVLPTYLWTSYHWSEILHTQLS